MRTLYKFLIAAGALILLAGLVFGCTPAFAGGGFMAGFGQGLLDYSNQLNQGPYYSPPPVYQPYRVPRYGTPPMGITTCESTGLAIPYGGNIAPRQGFTCYQQ